MEELSVTELKVVQLIGCQGLTTEAAAKVLGRSHYTVRSHAQAILEKTGAKRLAQAVYLLMISGKLSATEVREVKREDEVEHRLACPDCGHITKVTHGEQIVLLKQFDKKYPARTLSVECKCGKVQFVLQARFPLDTSGNGRFT